MELWNWYTLSRRKRNNILCGCNVKDKEINEEREVRRTDCIIVSINLDIHNCISLCLCVYVMYNIQWTRSLINVWVSGWLLCVCYFKCVSIRTVICAEQRIQNHHKSRHESKHRTVTTNLGYYNTIMMRSIDNWMVLTHGSGVNSNGNK